MYQKEYAQIKENMSQMMKLYETQKKDWMGIPITRENPLSYMLIKQKIKFFNLLLPSESAKNNIALISIRGLRMLETIRNYYPQLYEEYLFMFQIINDFKCPPTFEIMQIMNNMLERLESVIQTKPNGLFIKGYRP